jgi:hypothetical protein
MWRNLAVNLNLYDIQGFGIKKIETLHLPGGKIPDYHACSVIWLAPER